MLQNNIKTWTGMANCVKKLNNVDSLVPGHATTSHYKSLLPISTIGHGNTLCIIILIDSPFQMQ